MGGLDLFGFFPVVKALFLLTVSFFVLLAVTKTDSKGLKIFGKTISITIWIIAACLIIVAIYSSVKGESCHPYDKMFHKKMMHHRMMR